MIKNSTGRFFTTVPTLSWWVSDKLEKHRRRKKGKADADAIDNLERLYRLKERGAISDSDFEELKEKIKKQI